MKTIYNFSSVNKFILLPITLFPFSIIPGCTWEVGTFSTSMSYGVESEITVATGEKCINGILDASRKCVYGEIAIPTDKKEEKKAKEDETNLYDKYLDENFPCEKTEFGSGYTKSCTLFTFGDDKTKKNENLGLYSPLNYIDPMSFNKKESESSTHNSNIYTNASQEDLHSQKLKNKTEKIIDLSLLDVEEIIKKRISKIYRKDKYCSYENGNTNIIICNISGVKNFIYENSKLWESVSIRISKTISIKNELVINFSISGEYANNTLGKNAPDPESKAYRDMSKRGTDKLKSFKDGFMTDIRQTLENKKSKRDK